MLVARKVLVDGKQETVNFVWTAAHVVAGLRTVDSVLDAKTGVERKIARFKDAAIVQEHRDRNRRIGESRMDARVVRYSKKEDLAILMVRKIGYCKESVVFYLENEVPPIGTDLYHVGSMAGQALGANSMTSGILAQTGRTIDGQVYDQTTVTASPGSSGGGVFLRTGECIGMLTLGVRTGDNFNFVVPIRRIRAWAKRIGGSWALDVTEKVPSEREILEKSIEDAGMTFGNVDKKKMGVSTMEIRQEKP